MLEEVREDLSREAEEAADDLEKRLEALNRSRGARFRRLPSELEPEAKRLLRGQSEVQVDPRTMGRRQR